MMDAFTSFLPFIVSLGISLFIAPLFIQLLKNLQFGQSIREEGPQHHKKKSGTPTLGGFIFLIPVFLTAILFIPPSSELFVLLLLTTGYGMIGFLDDFVKVFLKRNLGLTAKQKIIGQFILAAIVFLLLRNNGLLDTHLYIPGTEAAVDLGWFYFVFFLFFAIGSTNATNLTDGLDGLLAGTSMIAFAAFAIISAVIGQEESFIFSLIMIGGILGFFRFNRNPAKVFMGDTGSLAIGGALVGISILTKTELILAVVGGVFVLETLSVILQVASFKLRQKRIFKMSPIHHHFEYAGWSEVKVVKVFCLAGLALGLLGILLYV